MKIAFSNDHAGAPARDYLLAKLKSLGHEVLDFGAQTADAVDYPDYARPAVQALLDRRAERAVLVCGSGIGMSIVANRFAGIRCALATDLFGAEGSRKHNDANCLSLRARNQEAAVNEKILEIWLATDFESGGRHSRRVEKIETVSQDCCDKTPKPRCDK